MTDGHNAERFVPPEWMNERILDALGGREFVVELMSRPRTGIEENLPLYLLQMDMSHSVDLLSRLHEDGLLNKEE